MYNFSVTKKGWLITKSDFNELFINLSNVKTIQTYIDNNDEAFPFVIMLEMNTGMVNQDDKYQTYWGNETQLYLNTLSIKKNCGKI